MLRQNSATRNIWKNRILQKLDATASYAISQKALSGPKSCVFDFGETPSEVYDFLGDWRYLLRLFDIVRAGGYKIGVSPELFCELEKSQYSEVLQSFEFDLRVTPESVGLSFARPGLNGVPPHCKNVKVYLDGAMPASEINSEYLRIPFGVHPRIAASNLYRYARQELSKIQQRNVRILNAGSKGDGYDTMPIANAQLERSDSRNHLLDVVKENLKDAEHIKIDDPHKFYRYFGWTQTSSRKALVSLNHNRQSTEWLCALALSDSYLCLPGRLLLSCHNAYEAMSVGTIPILRYGDWFTPKLEDEKNCFQYHGAEDIVSVLRRVLNHSRKKIEKMRENVVQYYEDHLSETVLIAQIVHSADPFSLLLDTEWNTNELYSESMLFLR